MAHKKHCPDQKGFGFLPPESTGPVVTQGEKRRCMGSVCIRVDACGVLKEEKSFRKGAKVCNECANEAKDMRSFDICPSDWKKQFERQEGRCKICRRVSTTILNVVCSPKSNEVFGLVCLECKHRWLQFLWIMDHPEWLESAMKLKGGY